MPEKEKIREMFDSIAPEYDAFNHLTSMNYDRRWRRKALKYIRGPKVLDIACGTGDFSITIARHFEKLYGSRPVSDAEKDWSVTGADISSGMLAQMREKVAAAGLEGRVSAEIGDCCDLHYSSGRFDSVTVAFGVRNFKDRAQALQEILRVLKPGGRFVMLELGMPQGRLAGGIFKFYFTRLMPLIGGKMSHNKEAYRYLPASVIAFPGKDEWTAFMQDAGFQNVIHRALTLGICRLYVGEKKGAV